MSKNKTRWVSERDSNLSISSRKIELIVAAQKRGISREQMLRFITTGKVRGEKVNGRWYVIE